MSKKSNHLLRAMSLLILLVSLIPVNIVDALVSTAPPPVDMFQLPWDQGIAWYAIDGIDNGSKRPATSSHNFRLGGAIDFAPRTNMVTGENTSNFWVTAAAAGTVVATSSCYVTLSHVGGWLTQYQFLGNIQVRLGDVVARNQRIGIIADGVRYRYCPGYQEINVPHLHFMLRPTTIGASLAGWEVKYNSLFNITTFTKGGDTVGLFKPLMNVPSVVTTPTPTQQPSTGTPATSTPTTGTPGTPATNTPTTGTPGTPATNTPTTGTPATSTPTIQPSPTATLSGPYVSTTITPQSITIGNTALVTVRLNNVPVEGYTSAEFTCTYNANLFEVSNIAIASLFGADPVAAINGPHAQSLLVAIAGSNGNKATTSGTAFTFDVRGVQIGQTVIECRARVSQGNNLLTAIPFVVDYLTIQASTSTATPSLTPSSTPTIAPPTASFTPTPPPGNPSQTATLTAAPGADWLTFTNLRFGFQFRYPPNSQIVSGGTDNYTRINLPFIPGTNLGEKYLEVIVAENASTCQSPLATSSILQTSETVVLGGITFLRQTGSEPAAGNFYQWVAYSTSRNNVCVSLDFVLHSSNPGNFATMPVVFDYAAESAVFGQIASTYAWLAAIPTNTPTATPTVTNTSVPVGTFTPTMTSTPSGGNAAIAGQVIASKPVTVSVYDQSNTLVATVPTALDGRFNLEVAPGTYSIVASSSGFLRAQATETIASGVTRILPTIALLAGDIDGNNIIDQFDALTIGMNYNATTPNVADLNADAVINVLDLEALAKNYHRTGPVAW